MTALCQGIVDGSGAPVADLADRLSSGEGVDSLGAPFAAALVGDSEATIAADHVGFRHVYGTQQPAWAAVSTSAARLAAQAGAGLDLEGLSVFRLAGHHLDDQTAYAGVRKLPAAHLFRIGDGILRATAYSCASSSDADDPAADHANRLRELVTGFLEHHPGAMVELSGGLDSRLVLAAVPRALRPTLTAFTIISAGSKDGQVAQELARRYGMRVHTVDVSGIASLDPAQAYELAWSTAVRQDGLGRPLSAAAFRWVESHVDQAPRLSGHGGELARGLFEFERPHPTVRPEAVQNYIRRWIVSNDAVKDEALTAEFATESRELAMRRLRAIFERENTDWISALSVFYLRQRMQRWAGMTITDGCGMRLTLNPLMDSEVLRLARRIPARLRKGSRYVVRVMDRLDPELARIPLGSGLRPIVLDRPVTMTRRLGENSISGFLAKAGSKVMRTVRAQRRSAAGAPLLAGLVVAHWREQPSLLGAAVKTGLVSESYLSRILDGTIEPDATTVDFLLNLAVIGAVGFDTAANR